MNEIGYQVGVAVMAVHFINWLKDTKLIPFINAHSDVINRVVAFLAAIVGGLGMHFAAQGDLTSGGTLQITYPPLDVMVTGITHIAFQWGIQQTYFRLQGAQRSDVQPQEVAVAPGDVVPVKIVK